MGSLTTQSSESVSLKVKNRNKLCLSDAETQGARLRLLPGKE